jgi:ABC-2 type transport system permease protein
VVRDWRTLVMAFGLPLVMIFLFSYAITFDIRNLQLVVADEDRTPSSRSLRERFTGSGYFRIVASVDHAEDLPAYLDEGRAQLAVAIPAGYAEVLERMGPSPVQVIFDGSENNTAAIAAGYVDTIFTELNLVLVKEGLTRYGVSSTGIPPIAPQVRVWFNPELDSSHTIIPGLIAIIMLTVCGLLTSLTIVRERETGSLEGLIATPVRKYEIIVGKTLPYLVISLLDCLLVAGVGVFVFDVAFNGSLLLFAAAAVAFSLAGLGIGLLASVVASNQLFANQIVILTTMLPAMLLSGFMFPIKSMPGWVQTITYAVPARYFVALARGLMLKDQPLGDVAPPILLLLLLAAVLFSLALVRFRKKL